jgi:hypothetical protein
MARMRSPLLKIQLGDFSALVLKFLELKRGDLLCPHRDGGIDAQRPPCRQVARQHRDQQQHRGACRKGARQSDRDPDGREVVSGRLRRSWRAPKRMSPMMECVTSDMGGL